MSYIKSFITWQRKRQRELELDLIAKQRDLDQVKINLMARQRELDLIERQRDLDRDMINLMNEDKTYLPTLQEAELFRNYILEFIEIYGEDDLQKNVIPQLFNLYFIDIAKEVLNDLA